MDCVFVSSAILAKWWMEEDFSEEGVNGVVCVFMDALTPLHNNNRRLYWSSKIRSFIESLAYYGFYLNNITLARVIVIFSTILIEDIVKCEDSETLCYAPAA